jgi:hypothetical protein
MWFPSLRLALSLRENTILIGTEIAMPEAVTGDHQVVGSASLNWQR